MVKERYTEDEEEVLVTGVEEFSRILTQKGNGPRINAAKNRVWATITERVRAVSEPGVERETQKVREKWKHMKSGIKKAASNRRKSAAQTGGGDEEVKPLSGFEDRIIGAGLLTTEEIEGLPGGTDTASDTVEQQQMAITAEGEALVKIVMGLKTHLEAIFHGQIDCSKHRAFKKGGNASADFNYQLPVHLCSDEQVDQIMEVLLKWFCAGHLENYDYVFKVLLPETIHKIYDAELDEAVGSSQDEFSQAMPSPDESSPDVSSPDNLAAEEATKEGRATSAGKRAKPPTNCGLPKKQKVSESRNVPAAKPPTNCGLPKKQKVSESWNVPAGEGAESITLTVHGGSDQPPPQAKSHNKQVASSPSLLERQVEAQESLLVVERERLSLERERLVVEKERLTVEREILVALKAHEVSAGQSATTETGLYHGSTMTHLLMSSPPEARMYSSTMPRPPMPSSPFQMSGYHRGGGGPMPRPPMPSSPFQMSGYHSGGGGPTIQQVHTEDTGTEILTYTHLA